MSMIFHLVACLKQLGFEIQTKEIICLHEIVDYSFLFKEIDIKKLKKRRFLNSLEAKLKKMYIEKRNANATCKVESLLIAIWHKIEISMEDEALYPFRNAMIADMIKQQDLIYIEVIHELCYFLIKTRTSKAEDSISMAYIQIFLLPSLFCTASKKYGGSKCSDVDLMFMKTFSVILKVAADELNKPKK